MPKTDASIALSLQDNMSASIKKAQSSLSVFDNDVEGLQKRLDALNRTKFELKAVDLKKAKEELASAKKAFEELGDAATETERETAKADFETATQNYENLRNQLDLLSRQARQTKKDMLDAADSMSKAENRAASSASGSLSINGVLSALGEAGAWDVAGDVAGQWAGVLATSAGGSAGGNLFSSALSTAGTGAAIGTMIGGPGLGTVIGAGIGTIAGLASGAAANFENEDAAFIDYYNGLYESVSAATSESITSGSSVAAQREQDAIAFNQLLGDGVGDAYLEDLRALAANTPMEYEDLTAMSRALATGFGDSPERMLELMTAIGDAGSAVGVTASDMSTLAEALSRMESSDKAALEYLNIFQDRGIDVIGMLASAMGKTKGDIYDMISDGDISGGYAVDVIQKGMETAFSGAMEEMSRTFDGLTSTLSDAMTEIDNARGESYNATRSIGLQADIEAYSGSLGQAMQHLASLTGDNRAYMENLAGDYQREALAAVLTGARTTLFNEEQQADLNEMRNQYIEDLYQAEHGDRDAKLRLETLEEGIQGFATIVYENSEQYKIANETELDLIEALRNNTDAQNASSIRWEKAQSLTQGSFAAWRENSTAKLDEIVAETNGDFSVWADGIAITSNSAGYAYGLKRVPYDNYLALLHEGERVLTANEARTADRNAARPVTVTFSGPITINQDSDIDTLAGRLADAIQLSMKAGVRP